MNNPYMTRASKSNIGEHGRKSESRVAKALSARLTPASGAMRGAKSDARLESNGKKFHLESKSTVNNSMSVELGWLVKVTEEALATGSTPALTMSFVDSSGKPRPKGDWVAVPLWFFQEMVKGGVENGS